MNRWYVGVVAAVALAACGSSKSNSMDLAVHDIAMPAGPDMAGAGVIGAPCTSDTDCHEGTNPVCFKAHFNNKAGNVATRGGYCSSKCTDDASCGSNGSCITFVPDGSFCLGKCMMASDCRNFYACFTGLGPACFPADNLDCDPTAAGGVCTYRQTRPGGCVRQALGTGMKGECFEGCEVGTSTCAPDVFGNARQCLVDDERTGLDGTSTGDAWVGPLCLFSATTPPPIADGQECLYTPQGASMASHYFDVCVNGDECYLMGKAAAGHGFDAAGDNKCHKLCYLATPSVPDAGLDFSDGGMLAAPCVTGTCRDVWGLAGTSNPAGLCL
jgi:hypothetical protein